MYKILIIEDEQIERETLYKILKEEFRDSIEQVFVAKNGKEALLVFHEQRPDIVLADINIPGINGLEVIRRIKQEEREVEVLILSSYNYFEYAQEAIRLGVEDFILKPYNITDLKNAVEKMIQQLSDKNKEKRDHYELLEKIEKITPIMETDCLFSIISNLDELEVCRNIQLLSPKIYGGFVMILQGTYYEADDMQSIIKGFKNLGYRCIQTLFHNVLIFAVLFEKTIDKTDVLKITNFIEDLASDNYQYGIGPIVYEITKLHHSFINARDRLHVKQDVIIQLTTDNLQLEGEFVLKKYMQDILHAFANMDEEYLKKIIHQLCLQLIPEEKEIIIEQVKQFFDGFIFELAKQYPQIFETELHINELYISNNVHQEVPFYLHQQIQKLYDKFVRDRFKNTNQLVKQAIRFIDTNYRKQITLSDMAEALQISPYYISKLLNNNLNKTFTELVSKRRVEASKELLKSNRRIKEIAFEVGFQGQNYFAKIFKKYTGVTPKAYKNAFDDEHKN